MFPTRPHRRPRAFTLLELIVTIVVLAVLAALAVPSTSAIQDRARDAELVTELETLGRGVAALAAFDPADGVQASDLEAFLAAEADAADGPASTGGWALVTAGVPEPGELRVGNGGQLLPVTTPVAHRDETVAYLLIGATSAVAEIAPHGWAHDTDPYDPNSALCWFGEAPGCDRQSAKHAPSGSAGDDPVVNNPVGDGTSWSSTSVRWSHQEQAWLFAGGRSSHFANDLVPFDPDTAYRVAVDVKSVENPTTFYAGVRNFDVDRLPIDPRHTMWAAGSLTTLAEDLAPGDTVVHLDDSSGWVDTNSSITDHALVSYDYESSDGTTYAPGTYSRHVFTSLWEQGAIDRDAHTIELREPWAGHAIAAGTAVANARNGMTYDYVAANAQTPSSQWTTYEGIYQGVMPVDGTNPRTLARHGTAYLRFGVTLNYNASAGQPETTALRNVVLEPID